jgi:hypothetical protein
MKRLVILMVALLAAQLSQAGAFQGEITPDSIIMKLTGTAIIATTKEGGIMLHFEPNPGTSVEALTPRQILEDPKVQLKLQAQQEKAGKKIEL